VKAEADPMIVTLVTVEVDELAVNHSVEEAVVIDCSVAVLVTCVVLVSKAAACSCSWTVSVRLVAEVVNASDREVNFMVEKAVIVLVPIVYYGI
jgi:hypothetical protein